jgi:hypothetical protein
MRTLPNSEMLFGKEVFYESIKEENYGN